MTAPRFRSKDLVPSLLAALGVQAAPTPRKRRPKGEKAPESPLVASLRMQIQLAGLPAPEVCELVFAPPRKWRFDMAWPSRKVAVEVDGAVWSGGRHTRGSGFVKDCEKLNTAALLGWRVYRFPGPHVNDGQALAMLRKEFP